MGSSRTRDTVESVTKDFIAHCKANSMVVPTLLTLQVHGGTENEPNWMPAHTMGFITKKDILIPGKLSLV
jgi:hypothetical protein